MARTRSISTTLTTTGSPRSLGHKAGNVPPEVTGGTKTEVRPRSGELRRDSDSGVRSSHGPALQLMASRSDAGTWDRRSVVLGSDGDVVALRGFASSAVTAAQ